MPTPTSQAAHFLLAKDVMTDFPPRQKALLWLLGGFRELERLGLVKAPVDLTPLGIGVWDQLDAEKGPTDEQIDFVLAGFRMTRTERKLVAVLLRDYRDHRDRIEDWVARRRDEGIT